MELLDNKKNEFQALLAENGINPVIAKLKSFLLEGSEVYQTLVLIERSFRDLRKRELDGTLDYDRIRLEENRISKNLLEFIGSLMAEETVLSTREQVGQNLESRKTYSTEDEQIIKELYKLIVQLESATREYLAHHKNEEALHALHDQTLDFFYLNEILFDEDTGKSIREIIRACKGCLVDHSIYLKYGDWQILDQYQKKERAGFGEKARIAAREIPELKKQVRSRLRVLLGY